MESMYDVVKKVSKKHGKVVEEGDDYFLIKLETYSVLVVCTQDARRIAELAARFNPAFVYIYVRDVFGERFEVLDNR